MRFVFVGRTITASLSAEKLLDTKSTDRKLTLLHYIALIVKEKYPELANFYNELHFVDKAAAGEAFCWKSGFPLRILCPSPAFNLFQLEGDTRIKCISSQKCLWKMSCWMFESWAKAWS